VSAPAPGLALGHRVNRAYRALTFLAVSVALGVLGAVAVAALALGATLTVAWIGLPLLLGALAACHAVAGLGRRAANALLDAHIPPLRAPRRPRGSPWQRAVDALGDRQLWRVVGMLALQLPLSALVLALGLAPIVLTAGLLVLGIEGVLGPGQATYVGPWSLGPGLGVALCLLALPAAVLAVAVLDALGTGARALAVALLAPRTAPGGPVREMLAESLGDRNLSIAYWLPDREAFVDEAGRPVELPEPGSGRAWTAVEHDGRRVAAIVHDAALETGPELVDAAAAAAALALDNERLKADLRARVEELRVSRVRIVEAADAARRRLERDLHDGAQQQLVSLALDLRMLRARVRDDEAQALVDQLADKLGVALADLRELARGIHPAILTDRGLAPAIDALADRMPLPVERDLVLDERLSAAIEAAAYFVVAEGLTNVAKYARAERVRVELARDDDDVVVAVADDGVGGARVGAGSGLRGLEDRLAVLDGRLDVDSPPGGGTRLSARIPCSARALIADAHEDGAAPS
jgi:signal transduction histidine kinase